jgi:hypothetical protein
MNRPSLMENILAHAGFTALVNVNIATEKKAARATRKIFINRLKEDMRYQESEIIALIPTFDVAQS